VLRGARIAEDVCRLVRVSSGLGRRLTSACTRPATRRLSCPAGGAGGRVMRGVRPLSYRRRKLEGEGTSSHTGKQLRVASGAWFSPLAAAGVAGDERGALRVITEPARPNKPMHPTADTTPVMLRVWLGAAGDWRR
jgi:hypothetical protein